MKLSPSIPALGFLALAGYTAALLTLAIHEILGHGLVAILAGGLFHDFYINPFSGSANTSGTGDADIAVTMGGALVTLLVGLLALRVTARRLAASDDAGPLTTVFLWLFASEAVLDQVAYIAFQPALASLLGAEFGDWLVVSRDFGISPWLLVGPGIIASIPLAGLLLRTAPAALQRMGDSPPRSQLRSYWMLLAPGVALLTAYLVAISAFSGGSMAMGLGNIFGVPAIGIFGLLSPWRGRVAAPFSRTAVRSEIVRWSIAMAVMAMVVGWIFGPSSDSRRGVTVGPANPDQYPGIAQTLTVSLDLESRPTVATFHSVPAPDRGSPFRRSLTHALLERGPSPSGAEALSEFIAENNLDGARIREISPAGRMADGDGSGGQLWTPGPIAQ